MKQLADISGHKILGNPNSEKGNIQEIDMGFGLSFSGGTVSVNLELNDLIDVTTNFPLNPTESDDGKMLFYDHSIGEWTTDDAVTHGTVVINGKKASAGTISKGLPVYLVGFDADLHTVELANSTSGSTMPVIGFAAENMDSTNPKHIITFGKLTGIDTTSTVTTLNPNGETWTVNDSLYMSTTTGGLTKFRPTGGNTQIQRIAKVLRVSSTGGQLFIFNTARTAGLPNLTTNKLWMGNNNGQPIEMSLGDGFTLSSGTISVDGNYGNLYVESTGNKSTIRKEIGASASSSYSSVFGGCVNTSSACYGTILNGRMNTILGGPYNSILNGNSNTNSGYISSNITSGTNNIIATPSQYSTIDNGTNNNVNGCYSVILNGSNNDIETTSQYSIIGSGLSNVSVGSFNVINSGQSNTIDGSSTNISTGRFNTISGSYNNISTGTYNIISGSNNFIGSGSSNTLTGTCISVLGNSIVATYSNTTYVNKLIINDTPTTNNSNTNLLVRNSSGQIELREASSFSGTNFANSDLTLTASRTHQLNGFDLTIAGGTNSTDRAFVVNSFKDVYTRGKGDQNNLVLGFNTGRSITSASNNVILGDLAGQNMTTAQNTVLIGRSAGAAITTTANQTVAIGRGALQNISVSSDNTAVGYNALNSQTSSQFNTAVGSLAGSTNVSGGSNVFIGYNAQPLTTTDFSSIVIGKDAVGLGSGTVVLGSSAITRTQLRGRVEMDTTTDGILLPRLTTAQMNAIASPATNLLILNTDLNGLYRYNGSAWVALSAGYGIIEVRDASGYPTFYADLQTAINATADKDTVYIHSDIQITSQVSLPQRSSLTFQMNGRRLWCDTTSSDFNLFRVTANSGNPQRHLRFEGGGLIEQTGTVVNAINAAIFHRLNGGTTPMELFLGTTIFRAENARVMYSNGFTNLDGGYLIATNGTIEITANVSNSHWDCYETCNLPNINKIKNCIFKTRYGGYFAPSGGGELENCHIEGDVTKSGNFGLLYVNGAYNVRNCFLRQTHATGRDALYVRGSGSGGDISNNVCINLGTGAAGNFVFGAGSHNYFYSNGGNGLVVGANCTRFNDNICITNGATTQRALDCQGTIIYNNTAINLNVSNTVEAMYVGRTSGTCQIYNNRAQVTNPATYNIKFYTGGTIYFVNNVMSLIGLGINPSPVFTNSQTNTPDAFGNIKIG